MDFNHIHLTCMGCFALRDSAGAACPRCGYDEYAAQPLSHLRPRSILNGKYLVGRAIGEGGFGITYIGWDLNLDLKTAIKEYYPSGVAKREGNTTVYPLAGVSESAFQEGRARFVREAKNLGKFYTLPGIVSVRDYFQENGTAYIAMEFIDGVTLKEKLRQAPKIGGTAGRLPAGEVLGYMRPIVKSLQEVHNAGIIHRDISPDNMIITATGVTKLIDFGAARDVTTGQHSMSVLLKPGFAPEEQYRTHGVQGAWTDIYALCATIYRAVTGVLPDESVERVRQDTLRPPSAYGAGLTPAQEAALMKGLAVMQSDRFQTMAELYESLFNERPVAAYRPSPPPVIQPAPPPPVPPPVIHPMPPAPPYYAPPPRKENALVKWVMDNKIIAATAFGCLLLILAALFAALI